MSRERQLSDEGPMPFDLGWVQFVIPPMQFSLPHRSQHNVTMLLESYGPLGVEIEPTSGLESLAMFPNSKWTSS
jgi:hypothetical protein